MSPLVGGVPTIDGREGHGFHGLSAPPAKAPQPVGGAVPVVPQPHMSEEVQELLQKARTQWLKCNEVVELLTKAKDEKFPFSTEAADRPPGGTLFLYDRLTVKFFRMDGHDWRKKGDGKAVRETHEKLKLDQVFMLNCYYAHAISPENLQRRCYWLLDSDESFVLVHYLSVTPEGGRSDGGLFGSASQQTWDSASSAATNSAAVSPGQSYRNWTEGQDDMGAYQAHNLNLGQQGNDCEWQDMPYDHMQQNGQWSNNNQHHQIPASMPSSMQAHGSAESLTDAFSGGQGPGHMGDLNPHPADDLLHLACDLPDLLGDGLDLDAVPNMMTTGPNATAHECPDIVQSIDNLRMTSAPPTPSLSRATSGAHAYEQAQPQQLMQRQVEAYREGQGSFHADPYRQSAAPSDAKLDPHGNNPSLFGSWGDIDAEQLWVAGEQGENGAGSVPTPDQQTNGRACSSGVMPCSVQAVSPEFIHPNGGDRVLIVIDGLAAACAADTELCVSIGNVLVPASCVKPGVISCVTPELNEGILEVSVFDTSAKPWRRLCAAATITVAPAGQPLWKVRSMKSRSYKSLASLDNTADNYHQHLLTLTRALLLNMPSAEIEAMALTAS